jgi:hypothetical protein
MEGEFLYSNEDLSTCDVQQYEISVKPGDRLITVTVFQNYFAGLLEISQMSQASITCPESPLGKLGFQALTSWRYTFLALS